MRPSMMPGPPKITLDQESFKALASEVRVGVLKKLDERRQTVTDLSNLLGLSKPTLLEHLEKLQAAGLVRRVDEGRKWIYYELSDKGRKILHPEKVSIVVALASAAALAAVGAVAMFAGLVGLAPSPTSPTPTNATTGGAGASPAAQTAIGQPYVLLAIVLFALAAAAVGVALLLRRRGRARRERLFAELVHA